MKASAAKGPSGRSALWLCYGGMVCVAIVVNLPPVYLTTFRQVFGGEAGLTGEQLGRIAGLMFASLTLGIVLSGPLADRWGAKLFTILGLALIGAGLGLMGFARAYGMLLLSVCLTGFGAGIMDMVLSPIVCALAPDRRASAMNWLHSFYCIGAVGTVLICSTALHFKIPWRPVTFAMIAAPAAVLAGFIRLKVPALIAADSRRDPVPKLLVQPWFLVALAAILLAGATEQGMVQWLPAYAETTLAYSKDVSAMFLVGFLVIMALGRILTATIGKRFSPVKLMFTSCILLVLLYIAACFSPWPPVTLAACIAVGLAVSCLWPTMLGIAADRFPRGGASMFSLMSAAGSLGCFIMPWLIGIVAQHSKKLNLGLAVAAFCPAAMAALLLCLKSRTPRPQQ